MGIFSRGPRKPRLEPQQLADQLQRLLDAADWTEEVLWDELYCVPVWDPSLDAVRLQALDLSSAYIAGGGHGYYGVDERPVVEKLIRRLRGAGTQDGA